MSAARPTVAVCLQGRHPAVPRAVMQLRQQRVPLLQLNRSGRALQEVHHRRDSPTLNGGFGSRAVLRRWHHSPGSDMLMAMVLVFDLPRVERVAREHSLSFRNLGPDEVHRLWALFNAKALRAKP